MKNFRIMLAWFWAAGLLLWGGWGCSEDSTGPERVPGLTVRVTNSDGQPVSGVGAHFMFLDIDLPDPAFSPQPTGKTAEIGLNYLTVDSLNGQNILMWQTDFETNHQVFLVERGLDDQSFTLLAEIPGAGSPTGGFEYSYTDSLVNIGTRYFYRLGDRDSQGTVTYHDTLAATPENPGVLTNPWIRQNYPNPYNGTTTIGFGVERSGPASLHILHPASGEVLRTLLDDQNLQAGEYRVIWDTRDDAGRRLSNNLYPCRFVSADTTMEIRVCAQDLDTFIFRQLEMLPFAESDGDGIIFIPPAQLMQGESILFLDNDGIILGTIDIASRWRMVLVKDGYQDLVQDIDIDAENGSVVEVTLQAE